MSKRSLMKLFRCPHRIYCNKNTIVICLAIFEKCLMGFKIDVLAVTAGRSLKDKMNENFSNLLVCFFIFSARQCDAMVSKMVNKWKCPREKALKDELPLSYTT